MATLRYLKNYVTFYPAPVIRNSKFELDFDYLNSEKRHERVFQICNSFNYTKNFGSEGSLMTQIQVIIANNLLVYDGQVLDQLGAQRI